MCPLKKLNANKQPLIRKAQHKKSLVFFLLGVAGLVFLGASFFFLSSKRPDGGGVARDDSDSYSFQSSDDQSSHSIAQEAQISSGTSGSVKIDDRIGKKSSLIKEFLFGGTSRNADDARAVLPVGKVLSYDQGQLPKFIEGQVIIKYKKGSVNLSSSSGENKANSLEKSQNLQSVDEIKELNARLVQGSKSTAESIDALKSDPNVEYAEPNYQRFPAVTTPNDPGFSSQWHLSKIKASSVWDTESASDAKVIVAVIDTGVHYDHQDLLNNMWDGSAGCVDEYGNTIAGGCPNHGWDYKDGDNNPMGEVWLDGNNNDIGPHGTWVSGSFGARSNNSIGVSGVSYRNNIQIMALRFGLDTFSELRAISFAKNNGAKIINASYGGPSYSQLEKDAIENFGGIFVAAAGNTTSNNDTNPTYPASYTSANIISVAATNSTDALASFSSYGATSVDLAAPGQSILTTWYNSTTSYAYVNGTSFAAPIVAGAAAMLESKNPTLSVAQVKNDLITTGDALPNPSDAAKVLSGKRLNVYSAYQLAYKTEKPVASSTGGTYTSIQNVTLSTSTQDATIYYTTDGSTPTNSSAVYSQPITIQTSQTLKAIAMASGYANSDVMSEIYVINLPQVAMPTFSPDGGAYATAQQVSISSATSGATIHYTTDGSTPTESSMVYAGEIIVSSNQTIKAIAIKYNYSNSNIGSATYTFKVSKPVASPAGGHYKSVQTVTLETDTPGAIIYYKIITSASLKSQSQSGHISIFGLGALDGYSEYTGPVTVPADSSLDVYASAPGLQSSDFLVEEYVVDTFIPTNMTQEYVRLDRLKALTDTGGIICANPAGTAMEADVRVTFPDGFTVNQTAANWSTSVSGLPSGAIAWPGISTATSVSGQTVTFPSGDLTPGNLYCFKFSASNTLTTGSTGTNQMGTIVTEAPGGVQMDVSNYAVSIVSNDQVTISAVVPPIFTTSFTGNSDAFSTPLDDSHVASTLGVGITVATNAENGWVAWLKSATASLVSASAGASVPTIGNIDGAPSDLSQSYGYLLDTHISVDGAEGSGRVSQGATLGAEYAGNETSGGTLSTTFQPIVACDGTTTGDAFILYGRARVSSVQAAASDYTDTWTIVTAGRF